MELIVKAYMIMKEIIPYEMSFEIVMFLYVAWKNNMMRCSKIYPNAIMYTDKKKIVTRVLFMTDEILDIEFVHLEGIHRKVTEWQGNVSSISVNALLSKPIAEIETALNMLSPTYFLIFLEHVYRLLISTDYPMDPVSNKMMQQIETRSINLQILLDRFTYFNSPNKTQWLRDAANDSIIMLKNPAPILSHYYDAKCPSSNYLNREQYCCPRREKYHMCHGNYFINCIIKLCESKTQLTFIEDKYVCMFIFKKFPHMITIDANHIEINNLYNNSKYNYPILRIIFWYLAMRTGIVTEQIFMDHFFEKLNEDLLKNGFIIGRCLNFADMIDNCMVDDIVENNRLTIVLFGMFKNGWTGDHKNGCGFVTDSENKVALELKNKSKFRVDHYRYAPHIASMINRFLKMIL
uniref:Uncharacterized protein n=1 Tax=viral metagenome TaxID=1070528 RepID=A0A6C0C8D0_9ZZZZ